MITQQRLKEVLNYDCETGIFIWLLNHGKRAYGRKAGTINTDGYHVIRVDGVQYMASNLAWLYMTGEWPTNQIDHSDLNGSNTKWNNLRLATQQQNNFNRGIAKNNTSGFKGVNKVRNGYTAVIQFNKKKIRLGLYKTAEEASAAYESKAFELANQFMRLA